MKRFSYVLTSDKAARGKRVDALARQAARFESRVRLETGGAAAALGELRAVLGLDLRSGSRVTVTAEGRDEEAAIAAIQDYFVANL